VIGTRDAARFAEVWAVQGVETTVVADANKVLCQIEALAAMVIAETTAVIVGTVTGVGVLVETMATAAVLASAALWVLVLIIPTEDRAGRVAKAASVSVHRIVAGNRR
jgi:hypothetical protein